MHNIIYKSDSILPWDTQSAFKMTSYKTDKEEHMVFCYLKGYVHGQDLVLCSYNFTENPSGDDNMELFLNLSPEKDKENILKITYGYDGVKSAVIGGVDYKDSIDFRKFKANDEQGFYWCGEIVLSHKIIKKLWYSIIQEKDIITLNMVQKFDNGDFSVLCGDATENNYNPESDMEVFVVLNY